MSNKEMKQIFDLIRKDRNRGIELLYSSQYNKLYAIAFMVCKDHYKSEDVVHNVILKLMSMEVDKLPEDNEISWLTKVIKNATIDVIRKDKKIVLPIDIESLCNKNSICNYANVDGFDEMLIGLDEKRKKIITLKVLGNYTFNEISLITGINASTARWFYNTGISKIKKSLIAIGSVTMLFLLLFVASLVVEVVWLEVELTYMLQIAGLNFGGLNENIVGHIEISPNTILLLYSAIISIILTIFFAFCYHNAYELPTKAKNKKR